MELLVVEWYLKLAAFVQYSVESIRGAVDRINIKRWNLLNPKHVPLPLTLHLEQTLRNSTTTHAISFCLVPPAATLKMAESYTPEQLLKLGEPSSEFQEARIPYYLIGRRELNHLDSKDDAGTLPNQTILRKG